MHIKRITLRIATAAGVLAASTLFAQMNHSGMDMGQGGHAGHQHGSAHGDQAQLPEPARTVFDKYFKVQAALAEDSLQGVSDNARALMDAIRSDSAKTFSTDIAQSAEDLAKAKDLAVARQVFKRLSGNLIKHLEAHQEHAAHVERVFCSMANAKWLQKAGTQVSNPYLGKSMARCGQIES